MSQAPLPKIVIPYMESTSLHFFMQQALLEGRKALPNCLPNPPIGCVIVKDGAIIARGHTQAPGAHHAEAMALSLVPEETEGLTLFVTLEPCSFQGRTPSCAKAIVARKVKKVYVGILDPYPKNNGAGMDLLHAGGVETALGLLKEEIEQDLNPYLIRKV